MKFGAFLGSVADAIYYFLWLFSILVPIFQPSNVHEQTTLIAHNSRMLYRSRLPWCSHCAGLRGSFELDFSMNLSCHFSVVSKTQKTKPFLQIHLHNVGFDRLWYSVFHGDIHRHLRSLLVQMLRVRFLSILLSMLDCTNCRFRVAMVAVFSYVDKERVASSTIVDNSTSGAQFAILSKLSSSSWEVNHLC
ncbi:hypothetical protein B0H13DRAFT_2010810 [Mycena leptocephala]|nr:hypothetical protein B0H13DRAFT_2010810 [Mycena leptocephala]